MTRLLVVFLFVFQASCAFMTKKASSTEKSYSKIYKQLFALQKTVVAQQVEIRTQKDKIQKLEVELLETRSYEPTPKESGAIAGADHLAEQAELARKENKVDELVHLTNVLMKGYSESPVTSNIVIQTADVLYKAGRFADSAQYYEHIFKNSPDGNKAATSLLGLARSYEKLGKKEKALEARNTLNTTYPGSREAQILEKDKRTP